MCRAQGLCVCKFAKWYVPSTPTHLASLRDFASDYSRAMFLPRKSHWRLIERVRVCLELLAKNKCEESVCHPVTSSLFCFT